MVPVLKQQDYLLLWAKMPTSGLKFFNQVTALALDQKRRGGHKNLKKFPPQKSTASSKGIFLRGEAQHNFSLIFQLVLSEEKFINPDYWNAK